GKNWGKHSHYRHDASCLGLMERLVPKDDGQQEDSACQNINQQPFQAWHVRHEDQNHKVENAPNTHVECISNGRVELF
ncbi:MAG: hypothetical protein UT48_C0047G0008, partial [Parcubacteria group bacterium GW2011_GWE2_39_37]